MSVGGKRFDTTAAVADKPYDLCERTFLFASDVVALCRVMAKDSGVARQISWQLLDAGTSVGANTEEAKAAYSRRDFASKNSIVLREARESRYWLRLIAAHNLAPAAMLNPLLDEANQLVAIYTSIVKRARLPLIPIALAVIVLTVLLISNF